MRAPRLRSLVSIFLAGLVLLGALGCARMLSPVDLPTMTFLSETPKIAGRVEVCVKPELYKRRWNVEEHPYRIELGKRAALNFERMAKSAFREAVAVYAESCGAASDTAWIESKIISANRDWDGIEGWFAWFEQEPVDTAITMSFTLYADDGQPIWSTRIKSEHRSVDSIPLTNRLRRNRGARDFGIVLAKTLDQAYVELLASDDVRAAFGDTQLTDPPEADAEAGTKS